MSTMLEIQEECARLRQQNGGLVLALCAIIRDETGEGEPYIIQRANLDEAAGVVLESGVTPAGDLVFTTRRPAPEQPGNVIGPEEGQT